MRWPIYEGSTLGAENGVRGITGEIGHEGSSGNPVMVIAEQLRRKVPGGIGTYTSGLLDGLAALHRSGTVIPEVTVFASRPPTLPDPLSTFGFQVETSRLPSRLLTRAWDKELFRVRGDFPVVHATSFAFPRVPQDSALVVMVHDMAWRHLPDAYPPRGRRWHEEALKRALLRARTFVVPSAEVADDLVASGAAQASVNIVAEGCDHLPPPDHLGASTLLSQLGVNGPPYLLSVGTLEPRKNLSRLIEAYRLVRPSLPDPWPLVVVGPAGWGPDHGPGPGSASYTTSGSTNSGTDGVVFAGRVDSTVLAALYDQARLLAYVPLAEGFGLPPVEAMHAGIPVVSSSLPSVGSAALIVDPLSVDSIAEGLMTAALDDKVRADLIAAGTAHAAGLTWSATAARHVALWGSA